ncbi:hypothetical protein [Clostridium butyricum]|uniref:hypothetical protein n=1 Tax=Clostridium butyricum TaxID=1492 RepID=UPI00374FA9E6
MKDYCKLSEDFYKLIKEYPDANSLINQLGKYGELLLFGGAVREYNDSGFETMPRDFDIVISKNNNVDLDMILQNFYYKKNRFNGYKLNTNGIEFDIWELENTWAFKENKINCSQNEYKYRLQDTVFLNIDSVVYNLTARKMFDEKYEKAMKSKEIDVVLEDNPYKELNMVRAIALKNKYDMEFSARLKNMIKSFIDENDDCINSCIDKLYEVQYNHYLEYKVKRETIRNELSDIMLTY